MKLNRIRKFACLGTAAVLIVGSLSLSGCGERQKEHEVVLRICNWEEYIDEGDWDEEETIDLADGTNILGENSMIEDFETWYYDTYGVRVKVEYSTFGTNEELYNQLTLGDTFDLVCPSEYMIMKLMAEDMVEPFSQAFKDVSREGNYYEKGLSPYIKTTFSGLNIDGKVLSDYAGGYMWGTLGIVYNPELVTPEEASTWKLLLNSDYYKRVTTKDSVRDTLVAGLGILNYDLLMSEEFRTNGSYQDNLASVMNDTSQETVDAVQKVLEQVKDNVYSFETDSGKADMVTGKVVANQQWSGDAVYTMDQAEEDGVALDYSVPQEGANLWFDGWVMLKNGIAQDSAKQQAAEAFINYVSRPDNVIRNMYYIGYTSVIAGGENPLVYEYADWCYGAEDDEEDTMEYPLGYFFSKDSRNENPNYILTSAKEQASRQLYAQYPTLEAISRCAVMGYFDAEENERISQMWINIRCFDIY